MSEDVCRICRCEETSEEPLFHPCRCSGSMKFVHQECLLEWLEHARVRTKCDVCGTDYVLRKKYRKGMTERLPMTDYAAYFARSWRSYSKVVYCVVRGVAMISLVALVSKYTLEFAIIFSERSPSMVNNVHLSWSEMLRRIRHSPPRKSLAPSLDTFVSYILPESEFRSAWINGLLFIFGFTFIALFCWFMAMWVLNEQALLHDLEHIELGEVSHMDQGDDESFLAELHPQNNPTQETQLDGAENTAPPEITETRIEFAPPEDIFDDIIPRPGEEIEEFVDDDEGAEELGAFVWRLIVDIFGGPDRIVIPGFFSALLFFITLAVSYSSIYWPSLLCKHAFMLALIKLSKVLKLPPVVAVNIRSKLESFPTSVLGHAVLIGAVDTVILTLIRLAILYNMRMLLKRSWGKSFVILAYQVYAVTKTLLMTVIETMAFPQYCGILMHIAILPITPAASWHWQIYKSDPYGTLFVQWLCGYLYMNAFQIFVSSSRKFFRKGVLFFLHDNDPVYFMRSIMILSLPKQLRRIGISAGIYGAFIFFGIGSTCVILRVLLPFMWPLEMLSWPGANILKLWPLALILSSLNVSLSGSDKTMKSVLALWLKERVWLRMFDAIARRLDLSSWLFAVPRHLSREESDKLARKDTSSGKFVRAPVNFPLKPSRNMNLFVPVTSQNQRLDGKSGVQSNEPSVYTLVWQPPHFTYRIALLALYTWATISAVTLILTLVPLILGRVLDWLILNDSIGNDVILLLAGLSMCLPAYAMALFWLKPKELGRCARFIEIEGTLPRPSKRSAPLAAFWAFTFTILSCNPRSRWSHWLVFVFQSGSLASRSLEFTLNFLVFLMGNTYAMAWCNAVATADFLIWQVALEALRFVPRSESNILLCSSILSAYWLKHMWSASRSAVLLSNIVREAMYLEATEVSNYDPEPETAVSS